MRGLRTADLNSIIIDISNFVPLYALRVTPTVIMILKTLFFQLFPGWQFCIDYYVKGLFDYVMLAKDLSKVLQSVNLVDGVVTACLL